jgi:hypothetical protein
MFPIKHNPNPTKLSVLTQEAFENRAEILVNIGKTIISYPSYGSKDTRSPNFYALFTQNYLPEWSNTLDFK